MNKQKEIVIVGGGFAGVMCALRLSYQVSSNTKIKLISNKGHFEYHATLYRLVTGRSPEEVCIPLSEIFKKTNVEIILDKVTKIEPTKNQITGFSKKTYKYDELVIGIGSQTEYYKIPGLEGETFTMGNMEDALKLNKHLHKVAESCRKENAPKKVCLAHVTIIGGGAAGVELAGELALYMRRIAPRHGLDMSFVTIDLIEGKSRLLPNLSDRMSQKVERRLRNLGVNIYRNRMVEGKDPDELHISDMDIKARTIVWTAGVKSNDLLTSVSEFETDRRGRVAVDQLLNPKDFENIYITGDNAQTEYSGMAQTALHDGKFVADNIARKLNEESQKPYKSKKPHYAIPVGSGWAAVQIGPNYLFGRAGWIFRRFIDLKIFNMFLPLSKTITAFKEAGKFSENCIACNEMDEKVTGESA